MVRDCRVGILSDIHGDYGSLEAAVFACDVDMILVCGDIGEQLYPVPALQAFDSALRIAVQDYQVKHLHRTKWTNEGYRKAALALFDALREDRPLPMIGGFDELLAARDEFSASMRCFLEEDYASARKVLDDAGIDYCVVPGNHDHLETLSGVFADSWVHGKHKEIGGVSVAGYGGSVGIGVATDTPPCWEPFERLGEALCPYSEDVQQATASRPSDIYISHMPPFKVCDLAHGLRHLGSRALRDNLGKHRLVACGHVHEAAGSEYVDGVLVVNAGRLGRCKLNPFSGELQKDPSRKGSFAIVDMGDGFAVEHYRISDEGVKLYGRKEF